MSLYTFKYALVAFFTLVCFSTLGTQVRIKELARIEGVQDNALIGYGLVVGLSGTGDSERNRATVQSLSNTLQNFSVQVSAGDIRSRNVAAVMVTASLPAFAQSGDKLEVQVSSIGDAKSLQGGTLLLTPLKAVDDTIYVLAQGALSVGGYRFDYNGNRIQKNHPTVGVVPGGGSVERSLNYEFNLADSGITLILKRADFTTASRIMKSLKQRFPDSEVASSHPARVTFKTLSSEPLMSLMADIEGLYIEPDNYATVVINERNGTIVAGAQVRIDDVVISHGGLKLKIETRYTPSQPGGFIGETGPGVNSLVIANSKLEVDESAQNVAALPGSSIYELVEALKALNLTTRELISVLQAIKQAGAMHAELIIQ